MHSHQSLITASKSVQETNITDTLEPQKSATINLHDRLFRDVYSKERNSMDLFRLIFTPYEFGLFDWETVHAEFTEFWDEELREKRADLIFSVKSKGSERDVQIFLLLEHKSGQDANLLQQMLEYQTRMYSRQNSSIIPILIYHGKQKEWNNALRFQDSLPEMSPALNQAFGTHILDFTCKLLNLRDEDVQQKTNHLVTGCILFILSKIWSVDEETVKELFRIGSKLDESDRRDLIEKAVNYIQQYNRAFSLELIKKIERETIEEDKRIMSIVQYAREMERKEGREEGREEGLEEGLEEGINQVAKEMIREGVDVSKICQYTKLTPEHVEKLQRDLH